MAALVDGYAAAATMRGNPDPEFGLHEVGICLPQGVTLDQMGGVVCRYLDQYPNGWQWPAAVLVVLALEEAFTCPKGKP